MIVAMKIIPWLAWAGVGLYARRLFLRAHKSGLSKGMVEGYSVGYCAAMDKVRTAIQRTNDIAIMAESMDDGMDAHQYTATLQQSLIVTLGVHDAERAGFLSE